MSVPAANKQAVGSRAPERREVVVLGGGQAGLAIGYFLAQQRRDFRILDAAAEPAAAWRARWDSLKLFTPARHSALPGLAFPGDPDRYPGRDEVVAYLTDYARRFELPVEPANATSLDPEVPQLHSTAYRSPDAIPVGRVLVVGGGNTGFQIAEELSASREVHLSIGSRQTPLPQRILGRDLFWYLETTGLIRKTTASRIGRRMAGRDTLIGSTPRALRRRHRVQLHGRAVAAAASTVSFADDTTLDVAAVIWATGFRVDHSWIDVPVFEGDGRLIQRRGVTESPGLYFLSLSWQHTRGSALLGRVKDDAEHIVQQINTFTSAQAGVRAPRRAA